MSLLADTRSKSGDSKMVVTDRPALFLIMFAAGAILAVIVVVQLMIQVAAVTRELNETYELMEIEIDSARELGRLGGRVGSLEKSMLDHEMRLQTVELDQGLRAPSETP